MTSESDYEDTDEELLAAAPPKPPQKTPTQKGISNNDDAQQFRGLFTSDAEFEVFLMKSEKDREQEIFDRMEEEDKRRDREAIRKTLEERENAIVTGHTEGHKTYPDSSSDEEFRRGVQRKIKKKKKTGKKGTPKAKKADLNFVDVFGDEESTSSSSDESTGSSSSSECSSPEPRRHSSEDEDDVPKKLVESREELRKARITRSQMAKFVHAPFFNDTVRGAFVQIRVGKIAQSRNDSILCQVLSVDQTAKTYDLEDTRTNKGVKVKYGTHERVYRLNFISNADWSPAAFEEWQAVAQNMNATPSVDFVEKKHKEITEALNHTYTDKEIDLMVKEKKRFFKDQLNPAAAKAQLLSDLRYAEENCSRSEVERIQKKIEDFDRKRRREEEAAHTPVQKDWMVQLIKRTSHLREDMSPSMMFSPKPLVDKNDGDDPFTRKREHTRVTCGQAKDLPKGYKRKAESPSSDGPQKPAQPQLKRPSLAEDPFAVYSALKFDIDFNKLDTLAAAKATPAVDPESEQYKMKKPEETVSEEKPGKLETQPTGTDIDDLF